MRGPLRWDDEARIDVWSTLDELDTLCTAANPQNPARLH
jgi:hypothetical protein